MITNNAIRLLKLTIIFKEQSSNNDFHPIISHNFAKGFSNLGGEWGTNGNGIVGH